jgi:hypothetical protein
MRDLLGVGVVWITKGDERNDHASEAGCQSRQSVALAPCRPRNPSDSLEHLM